MNKAKLIEDLSLHNDLAEGTKASADRVLSFLLSTIETTVANGEEVSIAGFGKFYPYKLASGKTVPKFKAFDNFKSAVA